MERIYMHWRGDLWNTHNERGRYEEGREREIYLVEMAGQGL